MVKGERVIAISEFIKEHIKENYAPNMRKVVVVPRCVDTEQFDKSIITPNRAVQTAQKIKIEHDRPIILLPARFTRWKGHYFLLEALAALDKSKYRCLFVGDVNKHYQYVRELESKILEMDLMDNVYIINNQKDMPALYNLVDIVVSASVRPEAFGRVSIEAQAMERIIVATKHGGSCETIIDGKTGFLVDPSDSEELAKTLEKLVKITDKKRKTITNAARKNVVKNFNLEQMTSKTLAAYDSLCKNK
jgi:glycosyltransferase involved in cell wall biosynthesis